jgi:hypothetical protein
MSEVEGITGFADTAIFEFKYAKPRKNMKEASHTKYSVLKLFQYTEA